LTPVDSLVSFGGVGDHNRAEGSLGQDHRPGEDHPNITPPYRASGRSASSLSLVFFYASPRRPQISPLVCGRTSSLVTHTCLFSPLCLRSPGETW
ncbi:hypothetical protein BHE74_00001636, partial [Ensete ventricosum]